ncbi:phage tail protein I [Aeromonas sp. ARM81]|uniref:phage tail protein I n=1 Tax=Aeromonas sp. ARM81 TaxID=1747384 RepID=UPI00090BB7D0|nr:phage tail protein I [Aeromonas sp. ARM81]ALN97535.1 tail protein I [Aeromonas phage phiARM81ld]RDD48685.1 phage tail protein I [Aeromonas sp. ARM81]
MTDSVQPDNRSALQVAIEQALDKMVADVDAKAPLPHLFDGMDTPLQFLPSLAIERGVIDWSSSDSEKSKRSTITDSLYLNSHSCTGVGLDKSLGALGYRATSERVRPYVFKLVVDAVDQPIDEAELNRIELRVMSYKAARDSVDIVMSRTAISPIYLGAACYQGDELTIYAYSQDVIELRGQQWHGGILHTIDTLTIQPQPGGFF